MQAAALGLGLRELCSLLLGQCRLAVERVRNFLEAGLDGLFVLRNGDGACSLAGFQIRGQTTPCEDGQVQRRAYIKAPGTAVKQIRQLIADAAVLCGERDAGEEGRTCRTNIGIGRQQLLFGRTQVGATGQQIRRQSSRDVGHGRDIRQLAAGQAGQNLGRNGLTQ